VIPKTLHRIWVGGPMPEHYREYGRRWEELHPGWSFRLWTNEDFTNGWLENQDLFDRAEE
jgi:mannosyltransferase OCH1-like enzyme